MRNIGYAGNIQQLWESLDEDGSGFITLEEFDPHTMRDYMEFRRSVSKCLLIYTILVPKWATSES